MQNFSILNTDLCEKLCRAAEEEAGRIGIGICFSIVDASGTLVFFKRSEGSLLVSVSVAQNKAYTAVMLRMSTGELGKITQPGTSLYGINVSDPKLIIFGGGFPLTIDGKIVGGIGVSGGSVEEDEQICRFVLKAFDECTK